MKQGLKQQIKALMIGCLVRVEWYDASVGKSLTQGTSNIDVPVNSWGIYLGVLGEKNKHIILAQNTFRYADGLYDVDYTAVPLTWTNALINITATLLQTKTYLIWQDKQQPKDQPSQSS